MVGELARIAEFLQSSTEILLVQKFMAGEEPLEERIVCRTRKSVVENIVNGIVADQMMGHRVDCDGDGFLDETTSLEIVRVHQRPNQDLGQGIAFFIGNTHASRWQIDHSSCSSVWPVDASGGVFALFQSSLLLAWREWLIKLTINEVVSKDPARAPGDAVCPTFDAGRMLLVYENVAALDEVLSLTIMRSSRHMVQVTSQASLKQQQCVKGAVDKPLIGGHQRVDWIGRHRDGVLGRRS